jgi:DNA-binding transcriptional LysR family regulator
VIAELEEAERAVTQLQTIPRGILRVTTPADFGFDSLARVTAAFQLAYPEIQVLLTATNEQLDLVAGGYDVALRAGFLTDSSLVARKLLSVDQGLFASPEYLARRGTPARLSDLAHHDCIVFGTERLQATWHLNGPEGEVEVQVSGRFASNDFNFVRGAALGAIGIARLPIYGCTEQAHDQQLVRVLPAYSGRRGALYAVYPSQRHLTPKVRAFVDFMAANVASLLAGPYPGSGPT